MKKFLTVLFLMAAVMLIGCKGQTTDSNSPNSAALDSLLGQEVPRISYEIDLMMVIAELMTSDNKIEMAEMGYLGLTRVFIALEIIEIEREASWYGVINLRDYLPEKSVKDLDEMGKLFDVYAGIEPYDKLSVEERAQFAKEYFEKKFNKENIEVELPPIPEE